jgi:hypothetical protein
MLDRACPSGFTERLLQGQKLLQAQTKMKKKKKGNHGGPNATRAAAVRDLVPELQAFFNNIRGNDPPPGILFAQGHRWGAAFPTSSFEPGGNAAEEFYLDEANAFAVRSMRWLYLSPFLPWPC